MDFERMLMGFGPQDEANTAPVPVAMTIAGSDSGGGAGIQADLKTFAAARVFGTSVVTLVTAQNTQSVTQMELMPVGLVRAQFEAVTQDMDVASAKLGALGHERVMATVVECLQDRPIDQLVVDPVMVSKHGEPLMDTLSQKFMRDRVLEYAYLLTPNRFEAQALIGREVDDLASMKDAALRLYDLGAKHVLIKGSHLGRVVRDVFYDGTGFVEFGADRIRTKHVHGAGCVLSAAITAQLALGLELLEAIEWSREFISSAIEAYIEVGQGIQPVNPMHALWR